MGATMFTASFGKQMLGAMMPIDSGPEVPANAQRITNATVHPGSDSTAPPGPLLSSLFPPSPDPSCPSQTTLELPGCPSHTVPALGPILDPATTTTTTIQPTGLPEPAPSASASAIDVSTSKVASLSGPGSALVPTATQRSANPPGSSRPQQTSALSLTSNNDPTPVPSQTGSPTSESSSSPGAPRHTAALAGSIVGGILGALVLASLLFRITVTIGSLVPSSNIG
ncbi:hypothetical protein LshimejAT787_1001620 [Lyophyllum shimeji]|uniref:Uncharacterized protein n=1 Tax=Lyophyllum shimeji TaxID=47721 RepID=A0A9P3UQS7_LYOSH|nr:hypothetical protein LshimejAT787_1001620 [Lyophyllum shimeji]